MEKTPNDKFRDAREHTQSPDHPDECLSRQELADQANTWIWEHHHKKYDLNAKYIGKIEQGVIRWPDTVRRAAFREIFKVRKDSELGFVNARARYYRAVVKLNDVDDVKRRKLIETTTLGVGALALEGPIAALLEILEIREPTPIHRRVGASDIAQIRTATQDFSSWSSAYGGGAVREAARGQLRWSAGLLEATCPEQLRPELYAAVGDLAQVAGYAALETGAHAEAHQMFNFALACAEQAKDRNLRATILSSMAEQAVGIGQPDEGLTLAEQALVRSDRLTPAARSLLHTERALALAKMHRVQEALTAIGAADEHFAHVTPDNEPSCTAGYTDTNHALLTGRPLVYLAILGHDTGEASNRLATAVAGYPEGAVRARAVCLGKLATLTMATGDPLHAATIGHQALEVAGGIRSRRATEELRELSRYAAAHQHLEEVEHLRQRIATLLCIENS